jgi:hypothetical protein
MLCIRAKYECIAVPHFDRRDYISLVLGNGNGDDQIKSSKRRERPSCLPAPVKPELQLQSWASKRNYNHVCKIYSDHLCVNIHVPRVRVSLLVTASYAWPAHCWVGGS